MRHPVGDERGADGDRSVARIVADDQAADAEGRVRIGDPVAAAIAGIIRAPIGRIRQIEPAFVHTLVAVGLLRKGPTFDAAIFPRRKTDGRHGEDRLAATREGLIDEDVGPRAMRQGAGIGRHDVLEKIVEGRVVDVDLPVVAGGRIAAPTPHRPVEVVVQRGITEVHPVNTRIDRPPVERGVHRDGDRPGRWRRVGVLQKLDQIDPNRSLIGASAGLQHEAVIRCCPRRPDGVQRDGDGGPAVGRQRAAGQIRGEGG